MCSVPRTYNHALYRPRALLGFWSSPYCRTLYTKTRVKNASNCRWRLFFVENPKHYDLFTSSYTYIPLFAAMGAEVIPCYQDLQKSSRTVRPTRRRRTPAPPNIHLSIFLSHSLSRVDFTCCCAARRPVNNFIIVLFALFTNIDYILSTKVFGIGGLLCCCDVKQSIHQSINPFINGRTHSSSMQCIIHLHIFNYITDAGIYNKI